MGTARLRFAQWAERRAPGLWAAVGARPVKGTSVVSTPVGTVWTGTGALFLVVLLAPDPRTTRWLAGSLVTRLGAVVLVPDPDADVRGIESKVAELCAVTALDPALTVIVGEGAGARRAAELCGRVPAARIALLYPPGLDDADVTRFPTTLIQASASGPERAAVVALDSALRRAGVAVRETEYLDIPDGWARYPRAAPGSKRALDDLVAFLERGVGSSSTFEVIPGWDLH